MFEQVKDYKSACKVLGIKPIDKRRKLEEHGTVGGTLIGTKLKKVPVRVYSLCILAVALVMWVLMSVLI